MKNKKGRIAIIFGLLLIAAALGLSLYNMWEDNHAYEENMSVMNELEHLIPTPRTTEAPTSAPTAVPTPTRSPAPGETPAPETPTPEPTAIPTPAPTVPPDYELNPSMPMPSVNVNGDDYIGIIEIPSLNIRLSVMSELTMPKLKLAPCRYTGSAYTNDMVIAAHNFARFFGSLNSIHIGAEVRFTDMNGNIFTYRASEVEILNPNQGYHLVNNNPNSSPDQHDPNAANAWDLTLFTCTKGGRTRVVVRCVRMG